MNVLILGLTVALALQGAAVAQNAKPHPLLKDKTGMKWVLPFAKALDHAKKHKRLLMIKPVAFGTEASGGW